MHHAREGEPWLDRAQFEDVVCGDVELAEDLLGMYRAHAEDDVPALRSALATADRRALARLAHVLRGASATLGLVGTAEAYDELELAAQDASLEVLGRLEAEARAAYDRGCEALERAVGAVRRRGVA